LARSLRRRKRLFGRQRCANPTDRRGDHGADADGDPDGKAVCNARTDRDADGHSRADGHGHGHFGAPHADADSNEHSVLALLRGKCRRQRRDRICDYGERKRRPDTRYLGREYRTVIPASHGDRAER